MESIIKAAKLRLRKTQTNALDDDIKNLAETAIADLRRIGVSAKHLPPNTPDALIRETVVTFVNANYGKNPEREKLMEAYNMFLIKIKGGKYRD